MRRATRMVGGALLLAVATAAPAAAREAPVATARTGALPDFAALPEGQVAALPGATPPARIAATEKVDGVFAARPAPARHRRVRADGILTALFPARQQALDFVRSHGDPNECAIDACLTDGGDAASLSRATTDTDDAAEPREWPPTCSSMLSFQGELVPDRSRAGRSRKARADADAEQVHAVRSQRLEVGQDGHATLSLTDVWIDARTRGVRLIGRSTLPLSRIFVGPNGLEVYAAREKSALRVVLRASGRPSADSALAQQLRVRLRDMAVSLPDGSSGNGDCGLVAFTLRWASGGGQMATLRSTAFLPSLDRDPGGPQGESDESRAQRQLEAMRSRPFELSVSATESSADATPVVSVALGWTGRERTGD